MRTKIVSTNDLTCFNYFDDFLWEDFVEFKKQEKINSIFFRKFVIEMSCFLKFDYFSVKLLLPDKIFKNRKLRSIELYKKIGGKSKKRNINTFSQNKKGRDPAIKAFVKSNRIPLRHSFFIGQFECFRFAYLPNLYLFTKERFTGIKKKMKKDGVLFEIMFRNFFEIKKITINKKKEKIDSCPQNLKITSNLIENQIRIENIFRRCTSLFLKKPNENSCIHKPKTTGYRSKNQNFWGSGFLNFLEIGSFSGSAFKKKLELQEEREFFKKSFKSHRSNLFFFPVIDYKEFPINEYGFDM